MKVGRAAQDSHCANNAEGYQGNFQGLYDDQAHRPRRIGLRPRHPRHGRERGQHPLPIAEIDDAEVSGAPPHIGNEILFRLDDRSAKPAPVDLERAGLHPRGFIWRASKWLQPRARRGSRVVYFNSSAVREMSHSLLIDADKIRISTSLNARYHHPSRPR